MRDEKSPHQNGINEGVITNRQHKNLIRSRPDTWNYHFAYALSEVGRKSYFHENVSPAKQGMVQERGRDESGNQ